MTADNTARRLRIETAICLALGWPLLFGGQFLLARDEVPTRTALAVGVAIGAAALVLSRRWGRMAREVRQTQLALSAPTSSQTLLRPKPAPAVVGRVIFRNRGLLVFLWLGAVGTPLLFGATALSGPGLDPQPVDYVGTAAFGIAGGIAFLRGTRMRLEADDQGVTAFGYVTTRRVPWSRIKDVGADYWWLRIYLDDGDLVTVACLGRSNWSSWLKRRTIADEAVAFIRQRLPRQPRDWTLTASR